MEIKVAEQFKTNILCSINLPPPPHPPTPWKNHAVYEIMYQNMAETNGPQICNMALSAMRAGYLRVQTQTHNMQYILLFYCQNTHFMFNNAPLPPSPSPHPPAPLENRAVCEIMYQNMAETNRPQICNMALSALRAGYLRVQTQTHNMQYICRAHWGMGLIFHQAKPRWTRREEDSKSSVLDLCLGMRS